MNRAEASEIEDLSREDLTEPVGILVGKTLVHYGMWFARTVHHHNLETALEAEWKVLQRYGPTALRRPAPHFGMNEAKAVNDFCWSVFGRMEAFKIRKLLGPGAGRGLPALKKALEFRSIPPSTTMRDTGRTKTPSCGKCFNAGSRISGEGKKWTTTPASPPALPNTAASRRAWIP